MQLDLDNTRTTPAKCRSARIESEHFDVIPERRAIQKTQPLICPFLITGIIRTRALRRAARNRRPNCAYTLPGFDQLSEVGFCNRLRVPHRSDRPSIKPDGSPAEIHEGSEIMAHEKHSSMLHEATEKAHALLDKEGVTDSQCFIYNENICIDMRNHGE